MAGYIKRDTAIRAVMAAKWVDGSDGAMAMEIVASPPAADVAPVVRCKDCKYQDDCWNCCHPRHHGILLTTYPLDFCSYGERRDGE